MSHTFFIYGLGILANCKIPGVPPQPISSVDVRIIFGKLPYWGDQIDPSEIKGWYTTDYVDESGKPGLQVTQVSGEYFRFVYADETEFIVSKDGSNIWAVWPESLSLEDTSTYLLGPVMGFVLLLRGCISLHASAIAFGDHAVALVGPAGAGKSTTDAAFAERGYSILAEDVVTLDDRGDSFLVQPAYPLIRLWPASVTALYGEHNDLPKLTPTWEKRYLDLSRQPYHFNAKPLRLSGVYLLEQRIEERSAPFVKEVSEPEAMVQLLANTYATRLMDRVMRGREFKILSRLIKTVPVRQITPHANPSQIPRLCTLIREDFESLNSGGLEHGQPQQTVNV